MLFSCNRSISIDVQSAERNENFDSYWFQSKAEITSYKLEQYRYGEKRIGNAALIFVTEPFNSEKNVKSDNGIGDNVESVLKLNQVRKFKTGIYPYSLMTSSFTPVSKTGYGQSFKVTSSMQEWCGQIFNQLVKKGNQYDVNSYSYFESEGDERFQIKNTLLEDEIMSLIRINPEIIKEGNIKIIPATHYMQLMHVEMKSYDAVISLKNTNENDLETIQYTISYPELKRVLTISVSKEFPFTIEKWTEEYPSYNGQLMKTTAVKHERMMIDYWNKNKKSDSNLYDILFDF